MKVSWFGFAVSLSLAASNSFDFVAATWLDDLIDELPDYGRTPTPHFSGFLDASDGCDVETNGPECKLHYWLALAENNPSDAPVVLWLNGGPGSSSILGFLQEEGPLLMNAKGGLMNNPWSWTKYVNLIALEAPAGVGYSYCTKQKEHGEACQNTDRYTASASRAALVDFFNHKFPEFKENPFFITGESYAGVYIPTLTKEILDNSDLNLKGIAVGDPCTDNDAQEDSMASLWYGHKYGLVDDEIFDVLWNKCDVRLPNMIARGVHHTMHQLNAQLKEIDDLEERKHKAEELYLDVIWNGNHHKVKDSPECTLAYRKFMMSSSHGLSQGWQDLYIDDYSLFAPVSSLEDEQMAAYMNRDDVRKALHMEDAPSKSWPYADVGFVYEKEYAACNWGEPLLDISMIDIYKEVVPQLDRTWIYNGDTDPCVSYEGTRLAVKQIDIPELDGGGYRPWFYNQTAASVQLLANKAPLFGPNLVAQNMGAQFGGEVVDYDEGLAFVTFHGSGHMVPQFRPQAALAFLKAFVDGHLLSPLLPMNSTMVDYSDRDFADIMDAWTEDARSAPYVNENEVADTAAATKSTTTPGKDGDSTAETSAIAASQA